MQTLNIILLISSLAIMVVGIVLTWKPNPVYYFNEKTGKADKLPNNLSELFIFIPGIIFNILVYLNIDFVTSTIVYFSTFTFLVIIGVIYYYRLKAKNKTEINNVSSKKEKNSFGSFKPFIFGFSVGVFNKNQLLLWIVIAIITIDSAYGIIMRYKKQKYYNAYTHTALWLTYITTVLCMHIMFAETFPENITYTQMVLIFLIPVMLVLQSLETIKLSPMYEKQYLEENAQQGNVSNTP